MFEGVVSQVLAGYLGRYIKGIQKDQLKIGLWSEEVLLEKVELILEAFDYLQLPFALHNGRVGKLSIRIPWKKLGWEPIIVVLEDVFICACQREDSEWGKESVEKRELAGKMAKLNAVELAKFSKCVADNQAGQSFISYISAKILDSIQVSVRNVHIVYIDSNNNLEKFMFGLRFSSLTVMTDPRKHNATASATGKFRGSQVNKIVEISNVGVHCNSLRNSNDFLENGDADNSRFQCNAKLDSGGYDYLVNPFDVTVSIVVNKTVKGDGAPQYAVNSELNTLMISLNEIQLQQILCLWDHFAVCKLREKYGRYRPPYKSLIEKCNGWKRMWWHYAQESVLADVRKKLWRTSWRNFGSRINHRHKYVNLYRKKLELLQHDQVIDKDILEELEKMDKECDIDDILSYRSIAEQQLQELHLSSRNITSGTTESTVAQEKQLFGERPSGGARGWLNWLSLGMLGAGGTADSNSFAGVISDDIVKDIYEATEFHPVHTLNDDSCRRDEFTLVSLRSSINQIVVLISSKKSDRTVAEIILGGIGSECKYRDGSASILLLIDSTKITDPCNENVILTSKVELSEGSSLKGVPPFIGMLVKMPTSDQKSEQSVKVELQPFEVTYDPHFFLAILQFYDLWSSFQFQHNRVLESLNRLDNFSTRLLAKAEYIVYTRGRLNWDVTLHGIIMRLPLKSENYEDLLMGGAVSFRSKVMQENGFGTFNNSYSNNFMMKTFEANSASCRSLISKDLYDHFEIELSAFEVNLSKHCVSEVVSIVKRFKASFVYGLCIFLDEPMLTKLAVDCVVPSVVMHFSKEIFDALVEAFDKCSIGKANQVVGSVLDSTKIDKAEYLSPFRFFLSAKSDCCCFHVDLEDAAESSQTASFTLGCIGIGCSLQEHLDFWIVVKVMKIDALNLKSETDTNILCSLTSCSDNKVQVEYDGPISAPVTCEGSPCSEGCFELHYQVTRDGGIVNHWYHLSISDIELHIHPRFFGLLQNLVHIIEQRVRSASYVKRTVGLHQDNKMGFTKYSRFGFSNFSHTESGISMGIAIENFPFLTVCNSGLFTNFGGFLDPNTHELKRLYANDKSYTRSEKLNAKKRCRTKNCSMMKHEFCPDSVDPSISASYVSLFMVDVNFNQLRVHFHDSSCILGTVTVPVSMCSFTFEGADCWDVLISVDDLLLSSSWTPSNIQQSLWGPVSSGAPSVLNVRVRKELREAMYPVTEISIGVQHVLCILPSEYLAMVIGYFSLPDWTAKESGQSTSRNAEFVNLENTQFTILYKVEVLDSAVILPLKNIADQFLHLGLPQAYCSFIPTSNLPEANRDIPPECMITDTKLADRTDAINIFVRGTSLCLMLPDVNEFPLKFDWSKSMRSVPIISELDAGLWIRIPCGTQSSEGSAFPTSIMMKADVCNLTAEAEYFSTSLDAVARVIDQLSAVGKESEFFHIDVFQFLQLKRHSKGIDDIVGAVSNGSLINVRSCITALSVKLSHLQTLGSSSPVVAKADMKLNFFTILRNEIPQIIDVNISALTLHSFKNSALLASFSPDDTVFSPLSINFSTLDNDKDELVLSVPCFDIWLYLSDWNEVIDLLSLYSLASNSTSSTTSGCSRPLGQTQVVSKSETFSCAVPECNLEDNVILTLKTENCLVSFYLPVCDKEEQLDNPGVTKTREVLPSFEATNKRLLKFTLHTKYTELSVGGNHVKLESRLEKLRALLETIQNDEVISVPLIQISHVRMGTEICRRAESIENVFVEAGIETLDVGLSYQIIQFWSSTLFKFPETASSQISWPNMAIEVCLKKGALLLSDGRWSPHGPILEILMHDMLVKFKQTEDVMEGSITMDLSINYNNIDKVVWEPFIEPWSFHSNFIRKDGSSVLSMSRMTQIYVSSTMQLNLNITEPLVEACFRVNQLIKDATSQNGANELYGGFGTFGFQQADNIHTRRYAPYILHNDTSLPLLFQVSHGPSNKDDVHSFSLPMEDGSLVLPGFSVPIYVEETLDEQVSRHSRVQSSGRLLDKKLSSVVHHMITIQLDGTSQPSKPMSMDLVGLRFFEVNFSNYIPSATVEIERDANASRYTRKSGEQYKTEPNGLVVPVAFEVSMYQYSKMIRLYSTVLLFNATSVPLEIRFDIPFGVSPKILDPILPGQESPLPLHLAEAGRIRWRPAGTSYLWSETHSLSNILSQGNKDGFLKPFVCYPTHPNSNPFRCCISVQDFSVSSAGARKHSSLDNDANEGPVITTSDQSTQNSDIKKKQCIRQVRLTTPLLVKNYLPVDLSLRVDIGGVTHSVFVSKGDAASVHYVDSTHELRITFDMQGFRPTSSKFPRAESFSAMSKPNGSKFSLSEILTLNSISSDGPVSVTLEKAMDSFSGAREICLTVPYLLYNCTGFSLMIIDGSHETKARPQVIPSSYYLCGQEQLLSGKRGLASLSTEADSLSRPLEHDNFLDPLSTSRSVSSVETTDLYSDNNPGRSFTSRIPCKQPLNYCNKSEPDVMSKYLSCSNHTVGEISPSNLTGNIQSECGLQNPDDRKAVALMYAPAAHNSSTENLVKLCASLPPCRFENASDLSWSSSFSLVPASGSASVTIPRPWDSGAFLISVASVPVAGELPRRTRAITFQPRYIICNVCNRDLCYKQKGANCFYRLRAGQHSHLHWSDTTRELLVSVRFNEPGWQWSGGFLPDCLGDTQVKMLNYVSGELNMVRAEVRNADLALSDQNVIRSADGNSMTQLILLSDDSTGFMPYRIDNFSVERLRIYQQKCANFESSVNPYTSSQYAWDEPCCPHRLVVEVPGERILGTYSLDDVREYPPIFLPSTSEKPERKFRVSIHAEGAVKVLSIVDLNCHIMKDMKETGFLGLKERTVNQKQQRDTNFSEMISIHLPFVGVSLINSSAQELIFASLRDTNIVLFQSLDQQKFSLQILSLQIDNQLLDTLYPIMLSFDNEQRGRPGNRFKNKENFLRVHNDNISPSSSDGAMESTIYLSIAKWRKMDPSLLSFKYVNLWFAPMCIELEEQFLISLFDFSRSVSSRLHCRTLQKTFQLQTIGNTASWGEVSPPNIYDSKSRQHSLLGVPECVESNCIPLLPSIYPIGAPWQQIYLLARRQKKIYIEAFELAPIKLSVSFSSTPWMIRNGNPAEVEPFARISHTIFQRGLMTLIDVEGVPVHLRQLRLEHLMASRESIQEILLRHYTWQLLHEIYKVFGSAGVIGNPMGFARNVGLGIKDFLSVSGKGIVQSPGGLFTGVAQGSKRLVGSTIYAISSATTQFSKAAHKGIVVFALDEHAVTEMDGQQKTLSSRNKGLLNEFLEGLTGLLQSPIRGAEKHGLPGVLSGIVMGTAGLVARPMASILEATGKAAQSIRNRSSPHQSNCFRGRLPRPLARELPLLPYSWEEAIGYSMLLQADGSRLRDELFAMCKELKQEGKFVIITERLILIVQCFQLIGFRAPEFTGVAADPGWIIETEMSLESVVHIDREGERVNVVGSNLPSRQKKFGARNRPWSPPISAPLYQISVELPNELEAKGVLQVLVSTIERGKETKKRVHVLQRSNLR